MELSIVSLIISVIMMVVGVFSAFSAYKERHAKSSAEQAQIAIKIEALSGHITQMDDDLKKASNGYYRNHESIVALEIKVKALEERVKALETALDEVNSKILRREHG